VIGGSIWAQWKPIVITICRHCSWIRDDDSQLSHLGRQSGLGVLKRQRSRRWLSTYHSLVCHLLVLNNGDMQHGTTDGKTVQTIVSPFGWLLSSRTVQSTGRVSMGNQNLELTLFMLFTCHLGQWFLMLCDKIKSLLVILWDQFYRAQREPYFSNCCDWFSILEAKNCFCWFLVA